MQDETSGITKRLRVTAWTLFLSIATLTTISDLWTKHVAFEFLEVESSGQPPQILRSPPPIEHSVIEGYFHLEANYNYGAFNGWFSEHTNILAMLSVTALVIITGIVWFALRRPSDKNGEAKSENASAGLPPSLWFIAALGLIAGGTAGNFYDRFVLAAVRDFIKWFYVDSDGVQHVWPNFNIADAGICVGVTLLILLEIRGALRERAAKKTLQASPAEAKAVSG
jgi:lipoprotein signal peptidase